MRLPVKQLATAVAMAVFSVSAAYAAPTIATITTTYSATAPTGITITGSGLCGSPCARPTVTLSGTPLTVGTYSSTSVTATLPSSTVDGEYTMVLTAGSSSVTQQFVVSAITVSVGTTSDAYAPFSFTFEKVVPGSR